MSNITSEKFRLAHLERDLKQDSFEKQAAADFREYLLLLINRFVSGYGEIGDSQYALLVKKLISSFSREQQKFTLEVDKLLKASQQAKQDFDKLIKHNNKPSTLPQEIINMSEQITPCIDESYRKEEDYYKQKSLCEQIEKMIAKLKKEIEKCQNENYAILLNSLLSELISQQEDAILSRDKLKQSFYDSEYEALKKIDEVVDAIRLNELKNNNQRGEE